MAFVKNLTVKMGQNTPSTMAQITGATVALVGHWKYEEGNSLVPSEVVSKLPTQMRRLHECYMDAIANC